MNGSVWLVTLRRARSGNCPTQMRRATASRLIPSRLVIAPLRGALSAQPDHRSVALQPANPPNVFRRRTTRPVVRSDALRRFSDTRQVDD